MRLLLLLAGMLAGFSLVAPGRAAPYLPASDSIVLERLPFRAGDPVAAELRALRAQAAAAPDDLTAGLRLARRYYALVSQEGDPRYIGYAQAALGRWWAAADAPTEALVIRATLKQYRHDFAGALADLEAATVRDPANLEALSLTATIHMVQGRYQRARTACQALAAATRQIIATGCGAMLDALQGRAREAHDALAAALEQAPDASVAQRLWAYTRLGEMAERVGDPALAERHYRQGLALGTTDGYLLAAYADLLLDGGRPSEVLSLLAGMKRSDLLLLRLALAGQALNSREAAAWVADLTARFDAARLRGDTVHQAEEARFQLHLMKRPDLALPLARENWTVQKEIRDARILLEAALAAHQPAAARPVLDWLRETRLESPVLHALARRAEG